MQQLCYDNPERCVCGNAPTLAAVSRDYGTQVAVDWLTIELNDYQNFVGVREDNKASLDVIRELSQMIIKRYYYLKLSELMLFFVRMKYGDYGELYGSVDAVRILRALRVFVNERNGMIDRIEQAEHAKQWEAHKRNAVSYSDYVKMKGGHQ